MKSSRNSSSHSPAVVSEQPGVSVFSIGVSIALVFGFGFRGYFSPEKVLALIRKSSQQIHQKLEVEVGSAELSLSKHGWPRVAVVIRDVVMKSSETCWMTPELTVNEIEIPVALSRWMSGENPVGVVKADQVQLRLNSEFKACDGKNVEAGKKPSSTSPSPVPQLSRPAVTLVNDPEVIVPVSTGLRELRINDLQIFQKEVKSTPFVFSDFVLKVKSDNPRMIELKAQSYFLSEGLKKDYSSKADLTMEYNEFPERVLQTNILGQYREGHFSINAQNRLDEGHYLVEMDVKHLPLSKFFNTLHEYGIAQEINPKQAWVSLKGKSRGFVDRIATERFEFRDFLLEGDVGEIKTDSIEVMSFRPLQFKPLLLETRDLDVKKMLAFQEGMEPSSSLGELGQFSGRLEIFSPGEYRLYGFHRGLEFIFSNMGSREHQKITEMSLDAKFHNRKWNLKMNRFVLKEGVLKGESSVTADDEFKNIDVQLKADEIRLDRAVDRLITRGGTLGTFVADLNFIFRDGGLKKMSGRFSSDEMLISQMKISQPQISIEGDQQHPFVLKTKLRSWSIPESFLKSNSFETLAQDKWIVDQSLNLNKVSGEMIFKNLREAQWKNFQGSLTGSSDRFVSEGLWTENSQLKGQLVLKSSFKNQRWSIDGTRDKPKIQEVLDEKASSSSVPSR